MTYELADDGTPRLRPTMASRRRKFAEEYATDLNGARAARAAGYAQGAAKVTAHRLLRRPDVQHEIRRELSELAHISFANVADLLETRQVMEKVGYSDEGEPIFQKVNRIHLKDFTQMPQSATAGVKTVRTTFKNGTDLITVSMYDKLSSLDKLMRYHGAYTVKNKKDSGTDGDLLNLILSDSTNTGNPGDEKTNA